MKSSDDNPTNTKIDGIPLITKPAEQYLNQRQILDYSEERRDLIKWSLQTGKDEKRGEGYAASTFKPHSYRIDQFYRWIWTEEDSYTTQITTNHADRYFEELKLSENSNQDKNQRLKALKILYRWHEKRRNGEAWEPDVTFKTEVTQPRDFLRLKEREKIRDAALEYGTIPGYNDLSPDQRDRWKIHLAQKLGKPKDEVKPDDWKKANGWKIPSLVYASLDAGLRPVEVEQATVDWVDLDNGELQIPKQDSAKNRDNWNAVLTQKTQQFLKRWLKQRKAYEKYNDDPHIWLTREGNPYQSRSLKYLLTNLAEEAGLDTENREFYWYMIRHSTGTYTNHMVSERAAEAQIRSGVASEKYDQVPPELRREGLEKM